MQQLSINRREILQHSRTQASPRSQTSRKSSGNYNYLRQSFEQNDFLSSRRIGLNIKDPQKVDEQIKIRQQRLPNKEISKDAEKDLKEISKAHDVLKNALPEINNALISKDSLQYYKSQIVLQQNPKKNFFEFNTYFYKNYQANNNGPQTTLPQILIKKVEQFQNKLHMLIQEH